jgi:hypothetical protein
MICDQCETVAHCTKHGCVPMQPAPVQEPSGFFRHEDVCGDEVGHPTPYYLTPPAAQPAVPDAIIEAGESPEFRDGWNECRETILQMLKARKA